jgi:serine protease Do
MVRYLTRLVLALTIFASDAMANRPAINDKPVPENRADLMAIQSAITGALPRTSAATVAIEIPNGSGTGVIVSPDGLILTAAHVSGATGKKVEVIMHDGKRVNAITLGLDSESDAAMIRITDPGTWPFVEIDEKKSSQLGDWVFALGHAGGFDIERGLVMRPGRIVRIADQTLQSDCILIGGDSGGPLFDLNGRLIAIHSRVGPQLVVNMHIGIKVFQEKWNALMNSEFLGDGPFGKKPEPTTEKP